MSFSKNAYMAMVEAQAMAAKKAGAAQKLNGVSMEEFFKDIEKNVLSDPYHFEAQAVQQYPPVKPSTPTPFMTIDLSEPKGMVHLAKETALTGFHRVLLMGDSGTGKTHFIGTMPKPFVADFDRGLSTLLGKDVKAVAYTKEGWQEFKNEVTRWRKEGPQYDCETFVLDSLTMASEAAMTYVLKKNGRVSGQPTIADWGEAIREVKDVLDWITTLQCNVAVTAHIQLEKDEMLGDIQYRPLIFGKDLPNRLGIWFDEVYATTVTTTLKDGQTVTKYRLQVRPDARNKMIKSRMNRDGKLFEQYEEPDFALIKTKATQ